MSLPEICIRRPVMTSLLMIIMLVVWLGVSEQGTINGFTRGDFVAYYMIGWVVRTMTAVWSSWEMDYQVRQGTLSPLLLLMLTTSAALESRVKSPLEAEVVSVTKRMPKRRPTCR